jgi:hypothetical protein
MYFNNGFKCPNCGPIPKAKTGNINKVAHNLCPDCRIPVSAWVRPIEERPGYCGTCGKCVFKSKVYRGENPKFKHLRGHILRRCLICTEVLDSDTEKILQKGTLPQ